MTDRALSDDDLQRLWDEAKDAGGGTWTFARLVEQAALASEHAKQAEPVATVVDNNQPGWRNIVATDPHVTLDVGQKLYAAPPADDAINLLRRLNNAAQSVDGVSDDLLDELSDFVANSPPADDEAVRLLREARAELETVEYPNDPPRRVLTMFAAIDAYLAKVK
jgi:hypothetical protein